MPTFCQCHIIRYYVYKLIYIFAFIEVKYAMCIKPIASSNMFMKKRKTGSLSCIYVFMQAKQRRSAKQDHHSASDLCSHNQQCLTQRRVRNKT